MGDAAEEITEDAEVGEALVKTTGKNPLKAQAKDKLWFMRIEHLVVGLLVTLVVVSVCS